MGGDGVVATIQEVARKAGVSIGTVSRAYHNYPDIRPETKERIFLAAKELGYTPNISARNLAAKRPPNIVLIVSGLLESGALDTISYLQAQGVLQYATENDLEISLLMTDSAAQQKSSYTEFCIRHSISGAVISGIKTDDPYCRELIDSGVPSVAIDVPLQGKHTGWVSIDNTAAAKEAMLRVIRAGKQRILVVGGKPNTAVHLQRMAGVQQAMEESGYPADRMQTVPAYFNDEKAYQAVKAVFTSAEAKPDGIFCFSDIMAIGALKALRELGMDVPSQVGVIGFDGMPLADLTVPPLATVSQDFRSMGYAAAKLLHKIMRNETIEHHTVLPYHSVQGQSL